MQISNVTLAWKNSDVSIKNMVANICTGLCRVQNKTVVILNKLFKLKILSG